MVMMQNQCINIFRCQLFNYKNRVYVTNKKRIFQVSRPSFRRLLCRLRNPSYENSKDIGGAGESMKTVSGRREYLLVALSISHTEKVSNGRIVHISHEKSTKGTKTPLSQVCAHSSPFVLHGLPIIHLSISHPCRM